MKKKNGRSFDAISMVVVVIALIVIGLILIGVGEAYAYEKQNYICLTEPIADEIENDNPYAIVIANAESEELRELEQILNLEAGGESFNGMVATLQVILNRVISSEYPDTIHGVLSQVDSGYRQFSTWNNRDKAKPGENESDAITYLVTGGDLVIGYDYLYFATRKREGADFIKIDHQWFSRRKK